MKLFNYELEPFIEFLYNLKLVDRKSRMRTRFIRLLNEKLQLLEDERLQLIREHARLDENGDPVIIVKDGKQVYDVKDIEKFNQAYMRLLHEEVVIDQTLERKDMLETVKDIVLNCGLEFEGEDQFKYDRWCEIMEQVDYGEG